MQAMRKANLDSSILKELETQSGSNGQNALVELVDLFRSAIPRSIAELEAAFESADSIKIEEVAHELKAHTERLGARHLQKICAHVERVAKSHDLMNVSELLEALSEESEAVLRSLEDHKRRVKKVA